MMIPPALIFRRMLYRKKQPTSSSILGKMFKVCPLREGFFPTSRRIFSQASPSRQKRALASSSRKKAKTLIRLDTAKVLAPK
jgi:hypothetical protein